MSIQRKLKVRGYLMLASFFALLAVIFSPVFPGKVNGLDYMDGVFNVISKGSSYFIPEYLDKSEAFVGNDINVSFSMKNDEQALETAKLFEQAGATVSLSGTTLEVQGDTATILKAALNDSDEMFKNSGAPILAKYGYDERQVLYNWRMAFKGVIKDLNTQKKFTEAKAFDSAIKKAIEPSYNYYGIESGSSKDSFWLIVAALAFYVLYTLWYGFGIMYLFEGYGLKVGH